jgi:hypothetical protein
MSYELLCRVPWRDSAFADISTYGRTTSLSALTRTWRLLSTTKSSHSLTSHDVASLDLDGKIADSGAIASLALASAASTRDTKVGASWRSFLLA